MKTKLLILGMVLGLIIACGKDETTPTLSPVQQQNPEPEREKSSEKQITSFVFLLTNNPIEINVVATIDEGKKTITAAMPPGTDITGLLPEVQLSKLATIDLSAAQSFTKSLAYTVTAEDGSKTIYTVTITALLNQRQILQTILDANPGNTLNWDLQNTADLGVMDAVTTNTEGRITELSMYDKKLISIPSEIRQLTNLKLLDLGKNQLTSLPAEIGQLNNLTQLYLSFNQLTSLPPEIGRLTNLTRLDLSYNRLTSLPPEIGQLTNLTRLDLGINGLTSLPAEIGKLTNLTLLDLSSNELTSLPPEIGQLTNLDDLELAANVLTSVPPEIGQLTRLELLNLVSNNLSSLPEAITQLVNLKSLDLRNNKLSQFNHVPFIPSKDMTFGCSTKTNLEYLSLEDNPDLEALNQCICNLDKEMGGTINIDVVPGIRCVASNVIAGKQ